MRHSCLGQGDLVALEHVPAADGSGQAGGILPSEGAMQNRGAAEAADAMRVGVTQKGDDGAHDLVCGPFVPKALEATRFLKLAQVLLRPAGGRSIRTGLGKGSSGEAGVRLEARLAGTRVVPTRPLSCHDELAHGPTLQSPWHVQCFLHRYRP